jgi:hypothetical protein
VGFRRGSLVGGAGGAAGCCSTWRPSWLTIFWKQRSCSAMMARRLGYFMWSDESAIDQQGVEDGQLGGHQAVLVHQAQRPCRHVLDRIGI